MVGSKWRGENLTAWGVSLLLIFRIPSSPPSAWEQGLCEVEEGLGEEEEVPNPPSWPPSPHVACVLRWTGAAARRGLVPARGGGKGAPGWAACAGA